VFGEWSHRDRAKASPRALERSKQLVRIKFNITYRSVIIDALSRIVRDKSYASSFLRWTFHYRAYSQALWHFRDIFPIESARFEIIPRPRDTVPENRDWNRKRALDIRLHDDNANLSASNAEFEIETSTYGAKRRTCVHRKERGG
jgi:hypothetical protein